MSKKERAESCCASEAEDVSCRVESLISVDERGQMILPKELRKKAGIGINDKLVIVSWEKGGKVCCMSLIKADAFSDMVKGVIGPLMKGLINSEDKK